MPRSVTADQIGSNCGCITGTPATGIVPIKTRSCRATIRVSFTDGGVDVVEVEDGELTGSSRSV